MDEKLDSLGDESVKKEETVVLVHGQGRTRFSMIILEKRFASGGFQTLNFPNPLFYQSLFLSKPSFFQTIIFAFVTSERNRSLHRLFLEKAIT